RCSDRQTGCLYRRTATGSFSVFVASSRGASQIRILGLPKSRLKRASRFGTCRSYLPVEGLRAPYIFSHCDSVMPSRCWRVGLKAKAAKAFPKLRGHRVIATQATFSACFDSALATHPARVIGGTKGRRPSRTTPYP